jgi:hypothetical protein
MNTNIVEDGRMLLDNSMSNKLNGIMDHLRLQWKNACKTKYSGQDDFPPTDVAHLLICLIESGINKGLLTDVIEHEMGHANVKERIHRYSYAHKIGDGFSL